MKRLNNKGVSLVEMMVAVAITAIVITTAMGLLVAATKLYGRGMNEVDLQNEAQMTLNQVADILMESTDRIKYDASAHILEVTTPEGKESVFWEESTNKLFYSDEATGYVLMADYVSEFNVDLSKASNGLAALSLTMNNKSREFTAYQSIHLRNVSSMELSYITAAPTETPSGEPTEEPSGTPTEEPTGTPTEEPTGTPTATPTEEPTPVPTVIPTTPPTEAPTAAPTPMGPVANFGGVDYSLTDTKPVGVNGGQNSGTFNASVPKNQVAGAYIVMNGAAYGGADGLNNSTWISSATITMSINNWGNAAIVINTNTTSEAKNHLGESGTMDVVICYTDGTYSSTPVRYTVDGNEWYQYISISK